MIIRGIFTNTKLSPERMNSETTVPYIVANECPGLKRGGNMFGNMFGAANKPAAETPEPSELDKINAKVDTLIDNVNALVSALASNIKSQAKEEA